MPLGEWRTAWRRLARRPGYAALPIAVLGVGLGVVLFLFSLINTPTLNPLPVLLPVVALVAGIALLSSLLPVLRALRVDPAVALRYE